MKLSEFIITYRKSHGLSQRQFAKSCNLSNGYISMLENESNPKTKEPVQPSIPVLKKIATGMGMSLSDLLTSIDDTLIEMNDRPMTVGDRIRSIRLERGLTQKELSKLSGVPEPNIRRYESGLIQPKYETIEKLATGLRTSTGSLLGKGSQIKYKVIQWKSRKDARLEINIDAELLDTIQAIANGDGLTLEDEVENMLLDSSERIIEDATSKKDALNNNYI